LNWSSRQKILDNVLEAIGHTPLIRLNRISADINADICVKLEYTNPSGSLKDRVVHAIVEQAEERGELKPGMILLEGTTGNTGIAAAMVGAAKGYQVIIVMPEGMSEERKKTIRAYGAELILTPGAETDVDLVLEEVQKIKERYGEKIFEIGQFVRDDNVLSHYDNTGPEIWEQTEGKAKAGTNNRNINTSRTPLAGITPSESLEAPYLNTSSLGAWGYVYQLGSQTVAVGSNVTFTDNGPLNGIVHMPGGPTIEVTMDGVYKIEFAVYTSQNNPQDWAVVINGVARARFNSAGQTLVAATILNLNAQDRVTIRNVNTIPDPARLREGDVISAYVLIYKLDS
jgi:cysteine synthase A